MGVSEHLECWGQWIGVLRGPRTHLEQKKLSKVNSFAAAKLGGLVGTSSVGFGPIELKLGGDAGNNVSYKGKSGSNCYFTGPAKRANLQLVDNSIDCSIPRALIGINAS